MRPSRPKLPRLAALVLLALLGSAPAVAAPKNTPPELVLQVFRNDKPVGKEEIRRQSGKEGVYWSSTAELQDKVRKVWRTFTQRAFQRLTLDGQIVRFDRWIDVKGASMQTKLFQFEDSWRLAADAEDGGKPKVTVLPVKPPMVVLDERLPSLVVLAAERMAGRSEFAYVRLDDATTGKLTQTSESLVDKQGGKWTRIRLQGGKLDLEVLRDAKGEVVRVKGIDGWSALAAGRKAPEGLQLAAAPAKAAEKPAEAPAAATPTGK